MMKDHNLLRDLKHMPFANAIALGKVLVFVALALVEIILIVGNQKYLVAGFDGFYAVFFTIPIVAIHLIENAFKLFALQTFREKIPCYVLDVLLVSFLAYITDGNLISTILVVVLSEFYLSQEKFWGNFAMGVSCFAVYVVIYAVSTSLKNIPIVSWNMLVSSVVEDFIIFALHFIIFNFTIVILRKNAEINDRVQELNESNEKLRVALEKSKEVTVLKERQRIAKDIHDTAGHSITTVIMQTEAAKFAIEKNPEDAKRKIIAANLQAKHALEELRESVHLLSGMEEMRSLRDDLIAIINESMDGTEIVIRSNIDEVELCQTKRRFICNTLKEGISNGLRHGGATAFYFSFQKQDRCVEFLLNDNGSGVHGGVKEGFGLSGMRKRAESLGGTVWFDSEEGDGFEIRLQLPLDQKEDEISHSEE